MKNDLDNIPTPNTNKTNSDTSNQNQEVQQPVNETPNENVDISITSNGEVKIENNATNNAPDTNKVVQEQAQTIGTLQQEKEKSPIGLIIMFVVLIIFIVFMPNIIELTNKILGTNIDSHNGQVLEKDDSKEQEEEIVYSSNIEKIDTSLVITLNKIEYSNFEKTILNNEKIIKLNVKNTSTLNYTYDKKLFLDFFDDNNTFINRVYFDQLKEISNGTNVNYEVSIPDDIYNTATKVKVVLRSVDDYPSITLTNNQLVCSNTTGSIIYIFNENKLTNIRDAYTYTKGSDLVKYNEDLLTHTNRVKNLNTQDGVTAVLTETDTGFITNVAIDYENADYSKLSSNTNYYMKDTESKIISFEMNSKGYICR